MATVSLATIRQDVYRAADQEDQQLCPTAEANRKINKSLKALRDFMVAKGAGDRFKKSSTIATVAGTDTYALPADHAHLLNVFWDAGVGRLLRMEECPPNEDEYVIPGSGWSFDYAVRYELLAAGIRFIPTPTAVYPVTLKYLPTLPDLVLDGDTIELWDGWEEWAVKDAAAELAGKEESSERRQQLREERDECAMRILQLSRRNRGEPKRVQDVYKPTGRWYY